MLTPRPSENGCCSGPAVSEWSKEGGREGGRDNIDTGKPLNKGPLRNIESVLYSEVSPYSVLARTETKCPLFRGSFFGGFIVSEFGCTLTFDILMNCVSISALTLKIGSFRISCTTQKLVCGEERGKEEGGRF